jgi:hypothetical protein
MPDEGVEIVRRYDRLADQKTVTETNLQQIADNLFGSRDFTVKRTRGEYRGVEIYDGTARQASNLLSSGLHTMLTNTATRWMGLGPEDERLLDIEGVPEWFEIAEDAMYAAFNRPEARFMTQLHETYIELVNFGGAGLFISDDPGRGVLFSNRPLSELVFAANAQGVIDTVYRKFPYTARQAAQHFGEKNLSSKVRRQIADDRADEESEYLHWVRPRNDVVPGNITALGMPWASTYVTLDEKKVLSRSGFHEMPYMTPRWRVEQGETYGRGPGWDALADGKMLNAMKKTKIGSAQLAMAPPWLVDDDGLISQLRTAPRSINIQRSTSLRPDSVRPLHSGVNPDLGIEEIRDTRGQVRGSFHWELLQLIQDPRMTATQVLQLAKQTQILLSPTLGRQHVELLEPMVERTFGILARQGRFPPPPPALIGQSVRVEYISAVARAQKQSEADALITFLTAGANLAQVDNTVMDIINTDEAMRMLADAYEVPLSVIRSPEALMQFRQARIDQMAAQQEAEDAEKMASAVSKLAPVLQQQGAAA